MEKGSVVAPKQILLLAFASLLLVAFAWAIAQPLRGFDTRGEDIYYAYVEGQRLLAGENPYARILDGDMLHNDKYATYFALFYLFSAGLQVLGWRSYEAWIQVWRVMAWLQYVGIGWTLLWGLGRQRGAWFGLAAAALWIANRWALFVLLVLHLDLAAVLLLLLSLLVWEKHRITSLLLLSVSLGLKQIGVFVAPLYLVWAWQEAGDRRWRAVLRDAALIASVPVLASLPFAVWNAEGLVRSLLFSVTRESDAPTVSMILAASQRLGWPWLAAWRGVLARLPMAATMALLYWLSWRWQLGRWMACLLVMVAFVGLNATFFTQYLVWVMALLPLAAAEARPPAHA